MRRALGELYLYFVVCAPPRVVILAPLEVLRNAERAQSESRAKVGAPARPSELQRPEPRRTPARLMVLEGSILEVFILKVGVLVDVEALRCGACHPQFLYVSGTERRI